MGIWCWMQNIYYRRTGYFVWCIYQLGVGADLLDWENAGTCLNNVPEKENAGKCVEVVLKKELDMENREKLSGQNNKWNIGQGGNMPIGFGLSLAANTKSMEAFAQMTDAEKEATVEKSRQMHTREDMQRFVNSLGE